MILVEELGPPSLAAKKKQKQKNPHKTEVVLLQIKMLKMVHVKTTTT